MDQYYDKVSLLLPMKGEDQGTVFTDFSPVPKTVTRNGDAKTVTAQSKFYGSSGYFDGGGDYLSVPDADNFDLGIDDFCIELWAYYNQPVYSGSYPGLLTKRTSPSSNYSFILFLDPGALLVFSLSYSGTSTAFDVFGPVAKPMQSWNHVAVVRSGSVVTLYLNGIGGTPVNIGSMVIFNSTAALRVGISDSVSWLGNIQDLRITKGAARYTTDFTPPPRLIGEISGTVKNAAGILSSRNVLAVNNLSPTKIYGPVISDALTGEYTIPDIPVAQSTVVCLPGSNEADYNSLVQKVVPV